MIYFFLTNNALFVYAKSGQASLSFPQEIIRFQEIFDRKSYEALLKNFFSKQKGGEAMLFLSDELLYEKILENSTVVSDEEIIRIFFEKIPFPQEFLAKKVIRLKKQTILVAAHREYYQTLVHIAQVYGWQIKHVIPISIFASITQGKQIGYQLLSTIAKDKKILEETDLSQEYILQEGKSFPMEQEDDIREEQLPIKEPQKINMKIQYIVALVCLLCFGLSLYFLYPTLFPASHPRQTVLVPTPSISSIPMITPSISTQSALTEQDIRISIVNGSGIAGQATTIKDTLTPIGFSDITTGNADTPVASSTAVFTSRVSPKLQQEIIDQLKNSLPSLYTQEIASSDSYDVVITTGASH